MRTGSPRLRALLAGIAALAVALLAVGGGTSMSAFTGSLRNTANTVQVGYNTCRAAQLADKPSRLYSLADANGNKNLSTASDGVDAKYIRTLLSLSPFQNQIGGCTRDGKGYIRTSVGVLGLLAGAWVSSAATKSVTSGSVLTQEVWFQTDTGGGQLMGFGDKQQGGLLDDGASTNTALQVFVTSTGRIDFATASGSSKYELLTPTSTSYVGNGWHHVVAVYNAGAKQLYVDGVLRASSTQTPTRSLGGYWRLGYDTLSAWSNGSASDHFEGGLQWAALYPAALTAAQVAAHYRAGAPAGR